MYLTHRIYITNLNSISVIYMIRCNTYPISQYLLEIFYFSYFLYLDNFRCKITFLSEGTRSLIRRIRMANAKNCVCETQMRGEIYRTRIYRSRVNRTERRATRYPKIIINIFHFVNTQIDTSCSIFITY